MVDMQLSEKQNGLLVSLGAIVQILKRVADQGADRLTVVMTEIVSGIGATGAALYGRCYDGTHFSLRCLAASGQPIPGSDAFPLSLADNTVSQSSWQGLNEQRTTFFTTVEAGVDSTWDNVLISPIDSALGPYGLIVVTGVVVDSVGTKASRAFLQTVSDMFSLWVERCNITKRFDAVFDSFPNPSFIMSADEQIAYWNKANEELTGWPASELKGKGYYTSSLPYYSVRRPMVANLIMKPDSQWQATYHEFVQEGDRVNALAFCPALPGGGGYLRTNTMRLYDVNNRLWGAIHAVRDVTLERKMRENLERSESMYRAIADFAGVGILLISGEEIVYANERVDEFFGRHADSLSLDMLRTWIKPKQFNGFDDLINRLLIDKKGPLRFEFQVEQDGETRYLNALAQLISYAGQDAVHFVIDDISKQKELEHRARSNELKLFHEERLTSLGIMAAGIAHELNQPLNTIRVITDGFLFCEEKGWGMERDELQDNIEMISRQVVRMSSVIQTIRNFSRDDVSQEFIDVSINKAVENVFSMIGRQLAAHNITVVKHLDDKLPSIKAPENRLEQVVTNLLINARQAFDSCSHEDWQIWITTGINEATAFLEIRDNATGIPEQLLKKIFYPFFTTKQVGQGTGLGLSICQSIVASMNGKLEVLNNHMGGATFVVLIPIL